MYLVDLLRRPTASQFPAVIKAVIKNNIERKMNRTGVKGYLKQRVLY